MRFFEARIADTIARSYLDSVLDDPTSTSEQRAEARRLADDAFDWYQFEKDHAE